jgi:D-glycero-alpha-D-manno-heptose 1-phosphate guanylyltransferase
MQAIVLAGGLGTRLRSAVPDRPKPMAPVAGRPFLAWVLDPLVDAGFERVVLAVGYRHELIRDHFGASYHGMPLRYSVEERPLGTGGAIRLAAGHADADPVFVVNGDTFIDVDHGAMAAAHAEASAAMSIAVHRVPDAARYGALEVDGGRVRGFVEKGRSGPGLINAGTYLLSAALIDTIPPARVFSLEQGLLVPRVDEIRPLAFVTQGRFIDIGVPEDYARAQALFGRRAGPR